MDPETSTRITTLIASAQGGDRNAAADLLPLVYEELRKLAQKRMASIGPAPTLQATALVHEAYLRVIGDTDPGWDGRGHFFAAAAIAMRNILVERSRRRGRIRHGGGRRRVALDDGAVGFETADDDILALDDALQRLEQLDERKSRIVTLRYFAGMSMEEIGSLLGVSTRTVEREWRFSRAWLSRELSGESDSGDAGAAGSGG